MIYIAAFYSHFGAIRYRKMCEKNHFTAKIMPVPRDLSSSCGTCVRYEGEQAFPESEYPEELEQVVQLTENGYQTLYRAKDS